MTSKEDLQKELNAYQQLKYYYELEHYGHTGKSEEVIDYLNKRIEKVKEKLNDKFS